MYRWRLESLELKTKGKKYSEKRGILRKSRCQKASNLSWGFPTGCTGIPSGEHGRQKNPRKEEKENRLGQVSIRSDKVSRNKEEKALKSTSC